MRFLKFQRVPKRVSKGLKKDIKTLYDVSSGSKERFQDVTEGLGMPSKLPENPKTP